MRRRAKVADFHEAAVIEEEEIGGLQIAMDGRLRARRVEVGETVGRLQ